MRLKNSLRKIFIMGGVFLLATFCYTSTYKEANASNEKQDSTVASTINQISEDSATLYPIHVIKDGVDLYGFINTSGTIVIKPFYTWARNFSEGLAVVNQDESTLIINSKGKVILRTMNSINDFRNGLASFTDMKNYKNGYLNRNGKVVIKASYDFAGNFGKDHTAIVSKSGKIYRINDKGKIMKTYRLKNDGNYTLTDNGYVIFNDTKTYLQGIKNLNGKIILKANYSEITYLGNDLFGVKKKLPDDQSYLKGIKPSALFDKNGKQLTSFKFYDISNFNNNYASCTDSKYTYLIDTKGKPVTSFPKQEGRGTLMVLGDIVQADVDDTISYLKMDGTLIWKNTADTTLSSGITVHSVKIKPNKYDVIYYPKLEGLNDSNVQSKINDKLKNLFTSDRMKLTTKDELMVDDNFSVEQIKDLLIICRTGYDYPIGAAHGMPIRLYYFVNIKDGSFYQFKDLFKKDSNYIKALDKIVRNEMKDQEKKDGTSYNNLSSSYITKDQFFYLSKDTLTIYFDSGAIAAYAAGFPQFAIPFSDIMNLIDTDGAFWKSFHE